MTMEIQGDRSGNLATPKLSLDRHWIMQSAMQRYADEGRLFGTTQQGTGVVTQAGLSATDAILAIHNPISSNMTARLWFAGLTLKVANTAAAVAWLGVNTNTNEAIVTGTAAVVRNYNLGGGVNNTQGQKMLAFTTATLAVAPVALCTLGAGLTAAITTVPAVPPFAREFYGCMLIQPGTTVSFQTSTASGAASAHGEYVWSEHKLITAA